LRFWPLKAERAKAPSHRALAVAHFAYQQPVALEVRRCRGENARHQREPVAAAGKRQARLVPMLGRQRRHRRSAYVRRIGEDQVVARGAEGCEKVGAAQVHAPAQPVARDVLSRDRERPGGEVERVDPGRRERARRENREAARAGAEVEHALDCIRIRHDPGKPVRQQLANVGPGHDYALIDIK